MLDLNNGLVGGDAVLEHQFSGQRVIVLGATAEGWQSVADRLASARARAVLVDQGVEELHFLGTEHPSRIDTLNLASDMKSALMDLGSSWGTAPMHGILNLWPLRRPRDIEAQLRLMRTLVRAFARPLAAGNGSIVTVCARPKDPLALSANAMGPALKAAQDGLTEALTPVPVRFNLVREPVGTPGAGIPAALGMMCQAASEIQSQMIEVGTRPPID